MIIAFRMSMPLHLMAFYGSFAVAAVLILRFFLRRPLPKFVFPSLWALVITRLIIPFSIAGPFSLNTPDLPTLKPPVAFKITQQGTAKKQLSMTPTQSAPELDWSIIVPILFCIGVVITIVIFILQRYRYSNKLQGSLPIEENQTINACIAEMKLKNIKIFSCDNITTPLVYRLFKPRIYLPTGMDFENEGLLRHVVLHELIHIKRGHNWLKTAMLITLCLNWYNPLVWVMAHCMGADLEFACDAALMKMTNGDQRHEYAKNLLSMALEEKRPVLIYNSFAKSSVKQRIKSVLRYHKTAIWALVVSAVLFCLTVAGIIVAGQAEFSPAISSSFKTMNERWLIRANATWDIYVDDSFQKRADENILQILKDNTNDDIKQLEKQIQTALANEFNTPPSAFALSSQLLLSDEAFNEEYAANGVTVSETGRYIYQNETVRGLSDQVRGLGTGYPLGTVDIDIIRDSKGYISSVIAYREGDLYYDNRTKLFPK